MLQSLRICFINCENLFALIDGELPYPIDKLTDKQWQNVSTSVIENKPIRKTRELGKALFKIDADIICMAEVGGLESLQNFNKYFLSGIYQEQLIEGNSDRGIDVGVMYRKSLDLHFEYQSNKSRPIEFLYPHELMGQTKNAATMRGSHLFSRDASELHVFDKVGGNTILIALTTHLKSKLDSDRIDPLGRRRREAEAKTLGKIYNELSQRHDCPILVTGDFNGNASSKNRAEEFVELFNSTDLKDCFDLLDIPDEERHTFFYSHYGWMQATQLDYALIGEKFKDRLIKNGSGVITYSNSIGEQLRRPRTRYDKDLMPSDHLPVVINIQIDEPN